MYINRVANCTESLAAHGVRSRIGTTAAFVSWRHRLSGAHVMTLERSLKRACCGVQDKLIKTIVANYILWPGAHFINFRFVPSEHRILCAFSPPLALTRMM